MNSIVPVRVVMVWKCMTVAQYCLQKEASSSLIASALHRDRVNGMYPYFFLFFMYQVLFCLSFCPLELFNVPKALVPCQEKMHCGTGLDFLLTNSEINRWFQLLLLRKILACNPSPANSRLLLQSCILVFVLLCLCCGTLHIINFWELVSGVLSYSWEVQLHVIYES